MRSSSPWISHLGRAAIGLLLTLAPGAVLAQAAEAPASAAPAPQRLSAVDVLVDHAKVIRLPEKTQTVVVGNPIIADVTTQRNGILVITGKSFGVTNLIALDGAGNLLAESHVRVQAATSSVVTLHRGLERESYSCTPNCQPTLQLGDTTRFFTDTGEQASKRNQLAQPQR